MSKKRKRQTRIETTPESRVTPGSSGTTRSLRDEFNPDYSYIYKDLRRIGTLAGTFLLILVILSFFLR